MVRIGAEQTITLGARLLVPMHHAAPRVRLRSLVREELRALPRNTFALGAVAVVFGLIALPVAGLMVGEAGLGETLIFTWLLLPLVVAILVAARVAGARRTRFVESLYTTPLTQRTWFAAQAIVGGVLGLLVLAVQVPFLMVSVIWLGIPDVLPQAALAALAVAAFALALGLFCGVVLGEASPLAAAGLAGGLAFLSFILFMVHSILIQELPGAGRDAFLRLTALSPLALAGDASGLTIGGMRPTQPWRPLVGLAGLIAGLTAAAWLVYTKCQGPLGWEPRRGRSLVVALVALALAVPVATASVAFEEGGPGYLSYEPGANTWIAFAERGAPITDQSFSFSAIVDAPDLPAHTSVEYDLLVMALAPPDAKVRDVHIEVKRSAAVRVVEGGTLSVPSGEPGGHAAAPNDGEPRPVYRVPVTLRAVAFTELGNSPAPVEVHTSFTADGKRVTSVGHMPLDGKVSGAFLQLLGAGLVLPGLAAFGAVRRSMGTR